MRLFTCLDTANACCLETVGEAIYNIELHATSTFVYDKIDEEIAEIYQEVQFRKINSEMTINEALNIINEQDDSDLTFHEYCEWFLYKEGKLKQIVVCVTSTVLTVQEGKRESDMVQTKKSSMALHGSIIDGNI